MRNPNVLRRTRLAPTVALLAAGAIACSGKNSPPPEAIDNKPVEDPPACTSITATPDTATPHTMKIELETTDSLDIPAIWSPDHAEYSFGDNTSDNDRLSTTHTYQNAGTYTVNATIVMDVVNPNNTPFTGGKVDCPPTLINVP
jgi:hypothetical protein